MNVSGNLNTDQNKRETKENLLQLLIITTFVYMKGIKREQLLQMPACIN